MRALVVILGAGAAMGLYGLPPFHHAVRAIEPQFQASFASSAAPERGPAATFTRATGTTAWQSGTGIVSVASGSPAIGCPEPASAAPASNCTQGVYVGAAVTSLTTFTDDYSSGWAHDGCAGLTANSADVADPAGAHHAIKIVETACTLNAAILAQTDVLTANKANTETVWLCGASGGEIVKLRMTEPSVLDHYITETLQKCSTGWQRFNQTATFTGGATSAVIGVSADGTHNGTVYAYAPNFYNNLSYAPGYDGLAHASTITVNSDDPTWGPISGIIGNPNEVTACTGFWTPSVSSGTHVAFDFRSNTDGSSFTGSATAAGKFQVVSGGISDSTPSISAQVWTYVCGVRSKSQGFVAAYVNGSGHSTAGAPTDLLSNATIRVATGFGSGPSYGFAARTAFYGRILTAGQILALYNTNAGSFALAPRPDGRPRWLLAAARMLAPDLDASLWRPALRGSIVADAQETVRQIGEPAWQMPVATPTPDKWPTFEDDGSDE